MAAIWFVSAAYGRYGTVRVALAQRRHVCDELNKRGHTAQGVIVAADMNLDIAHEHGFHTVERDNSDVSGKFNAGFAYALEHGADVVVYLGSDNWTHIDLFDQLPRPRQVMTGTKLQIVDAAAGRMRLCHIDRVYGVIPWLIPSQLLAKCEGTPIEPGIPRGFDSALIEGLTRGSGYPPSFTRFDPHDFARVDFKTADNLTPFDRLDKGFGIGEPQDAWTELSRFYPATDVELARNTLSAEGRECAA